MDKIKCIDCIFSSIDSGFCIVEDLIRLEMLIGYIIVVIFMKKMVEKRLKALLKF